jgi:hypothetical protein|tara:strand:+ start:503 stop:736 length:234 start_codon:yes stop_codon:yes gene_type:complete
MPSLSREGRTIVNMLTVPVYNHPPAKTEGGDGEQRFVKIPGYEARIYVKMSGMWWYTEMKTTRLVPVSLENTWESFT